jgi:hypothetical protein
MTEVSREGRRGSQQLALECPEWCTQKDNGIHRAGEDDLSIIDGRVIFRHVGPTIGEFFRAGGDVDVLAASVELYVCQAGVLANDETADPGELRQFAADALASAEWLGAHR